MFRRSEKAITCEWESWPTEQLCEPTLLFSGAMFEGSDELVMETRERKGKVSL